MQTPTIGLGAMGMSDAYGPTDRTESIATVHAALDAGVTLIDTGDFYGMGHNELLLAEALHGRDRDSYTLSVKFGALRGPGAEFNGQDNRPAAVKNFLAYSLQRLGTDHIDIYRPARLDPAVPIEDTIGALAEMVTAGHIRQIGLSEVDAATVRRAAAVHPIADLQIEYSLLSRAVEDDIRPTLRELGIGLTAYGVLGRGLISGTWTPGRPGDSRAHLPRFAPGNAEHNIALIRALQPIADAHGATLAQLAIAWVAAQGDAVVPVIGARTRTRLTEALAATTLTLTPDDLTEIDRLVPPGAAAGTRYPQAFMTALGTTS